MPRSRHVQQPVYVLVRLTGSLSLCGGGLDTVNVRDLRGRGMRAFRSNYEMTQSGPAAINGRAPPIWRHKVSNLAVAEAHAHLQRTQSVAVEELEDGIRPREIGEGKSEGELLWK